MRILAVLAVSAAALSLPAAAFAQTASTAAMPAAAAPAAATANAPATAPVATPPAAPAPTATASADAGVDLDKIECRTTPPMTGTRLGGGRECHTVRQWNDRQQQAQRMLMEKQQQVGARLSGG